MYFQVLGPLEITSADGRSVPVRGGRSERLVAALVLEPNSVVSVERLTRLLWDDPPATARGQIQTVVSSLRGLLSAYAEVDIIHTHPYGYELRAEAVDARQFVDRLAVGRRLAEQRLRESAVAELRAALDLWRGPILGGLTGTLLRARAHVYEERRLSATELVVQLELQLGRHLTVIDELYELTAEHPLRERLHAYLMTALTRTGRRADALAVYRRARALLVRELGLEPGRELQQAERLVLAG